MNYIKATTKPEKNQRVSNRIPSGWTIFNKIERNVNKPEPKSEIENNEPYYLDDYESYCFNRAIEDIYNRRLSESMKHYYETGEFDIFVEEARSNAIYLARYPDDEDYEYFEDE